MSYYRKRGSASYIVREVRSVRERERLIPKTIGSCPRMTLEHTSTDRPSHNREAKYV